MARKIRFPLKMKNGAEVRTLDELKANFDIESVLGYFTDGKLATWLADRYYDTEAAKVSELNSDSDDFKVKLCEVLGILYTENPNEETDLDYINRRNEKKAVLSQLTDEAELLNNIDSVALNQDDLLDCYDMGFSTIYLVGDTVFSIPVSVTNVTYIGHYGAKAEIRATGDIDFNEKNIVFKDISFVGEIIPETEKKVDQDNSISLSFSNCSLECDGTNFKEILELAKNGNAEAQYEIGKFLYEYAFDELAEYWLKKSIEDNYSKAMYYYSLYVIDRKREGNKAKEYMLMAAKNGYVPAQYELSRMYGRDAYKYGCKQNDVKAYEWLKKAAENGHLVAQMAIAELLYDRYNIFRERKADEAIIWFTKAAEQVENCPDILSEICQILGKCYFELEDENKAIEWFTKAIENGDKESVNYLKRVKEGASFL